MIIVQIGSFFKGSLKDAKLSKEDRDRILKMGNDELEEELCDMIDEADQIADPMVLFDVCAVKNNNENNSIEINGIMVDNAFVVEKLGDKKRCFPYICTCGLALEKWSE